MGKNEISCTLHKKTDFPVPVNVQVGEESWESQVNIDTRVDV